MASPRGASGIVGTRRLEEDGAGQHAPEDGGAAWRNAARTRKQPAAATRVDESIAEAPSPRAPPPPRLRWRRRVAKEERGPWGEVRWYCCCGAAAAAAAGCCC